MTAPPDPYATLGISPRASDAELRAAYRRAVQREHPDHNGGSAEAARRFEAVQEAYALIRVKRTRAATATEPPGSAPRPTAGASAASGAAGPTAGSDTPRPTAGSDPDLDARLAELERELIQARTAREQARRAAREAEAEAAGPEPTRPTDEELGYIRTDDSFGRIIADAASELFSEARDRRVPERVADLLDELGSKLTGEPPPKR